MSIIVKLNDRYSIGDQLTFTSAAAEILVADIETPLATASISLHGGQVLTWHPKHQQHPVLWLSEKAVYAHGKAIRGGVPICWPWFGSHPTNPQLPGHGYARISPWNISSTQLLDDGAVQIILTMQDSELSQSLWAQPVQLTVCITVGTELSIELTTTNLGDQDIVFTEGLHTYFKISDVRNIRVMGLENSEYVDLVRDNVRSKQAGPITFDSELGRIFTNNTATCVIEDHEFKRRISIDKSGSLSTAVWNPWAETASKMPDLGEDGWRDMVCVESANALENVVIVKGGGSHTHSVVYRVEDMK